MFCLSVVKDTMAIHPSNFGAPVEDALIAEINKNTPIAVLHDVGLCICVFDITQAGEGKVRYGDGFLWYKVVFRLVVFRPFTSEVIIAKVKSSDEDGIRLTLGFFDDLFIPVSYLLNPPHSTQTNAPHFWIPDSTLTTATELLDTPLTERMYIDQGEVVRVRVEADEFCDDEPGPIKVSEGVVQAKREGKRPNYNDLRCSIAEQGLGPVAWWSGASQEGEGEEMDEG
ncbi:polymerase III polypeptide H [Gymnopilus junonius]|uniref:Polymerase III polypeptide H n=1 Tax=Gymnopilus junonius TaxID=109634 RepID=A0A9P5NFR3_GYMJU|nr:polymerase III polypeptide H [Gymnopilus junonius]